MKNEETKTLEHTELEEMTIPKGFRFKQTKSTYKKTGQWNHMFNCEMEIITEQKTEYIDLTAREDAISTYFQEKIKDLRQEFEKRLDRKKDK